MKEVSAEILSAAAAEKSWTSVFADLVKARLTTLVLLTTRHVNSDQVREKLLASGLPNLWVPKIVYRVEKIPVLGTGKLDLKACRDLALAAVEPKAASRG